MATSDSFFPLTTISYPFDSSLTPYFHVLFVQSAHYLFSLLPTHEV